MAACITRHYLASPHRWPRGIFKLHPFFPVGPLYVSCHIVCHCLLGRLRNVSTALQFARRHCSRHYNSESGTLASALECPGNFEPDMITASVQVPFVHLVRSSTDVDAIIQENLNTRHGCVNKCGLSLLGSCTFDCVILVPMIHASMIMR